MSDSGGNTQSWRERALIAEAEVEKVTAERDSLAEDLEAFESERAEVASLAHQILAIADPDWASRDDRIDAGVAEMREVATTLKLAFEQLGLAAINAAGPPK